LTPGANLISKLREIDTHYTWLLGREQALAMGHEAFDEGLAALDEILRYFSDENVPKTSSTYIEVDATNLNKEE